MSEYIISVSAEVIERAKNGEIIRITPILQEIVRCRDCNNYGRDGYDNGYCYYFDIMREPDGFCAWGERRES